jgi:protein TonB
MRLRPERIALGVTLALHAIAAAALLSYAPARHALLAAAPIMVDIIMPKAETPRPPPPLELPKPKPMARAIEHPVETPPILTAPATAPFRVAVPPPPAPSPQALSTPDPLPATQPVFNADYLDNPAPAYPAMSRRLGEQGRVLLRVLVNVRGTSDEVQVHTSSGHTRLDEAARDTVHRWRFVPAKRGTEPVSAWVLIPISFRLEG